MSAADPVCNMTIAESEAAASATYEGRTFHFCNLACRDDFEEDPEAYLRDE